jgi:uncharacterized membrane protein YfcA
MTGLELAAIAAAAVIGATAQSATGFGVALPLAPVLFAIADPVDAVLMVLVAALGHNLLVLVTRHRHLDAPRRDVAILVAGALPGLVVGALLVTRLSKPALQFAVGAAIAVALALRIHAPAGEPKRQGWETGTPVGFVAGVLTTTVGINGPPMVLWLRAGGADFARLRDTLAVVFLVLNALAIPGVVSQGGSAPAGALAALAGGLVAGHVVGMQAGARVPSGRLESALTALLVAAACASMAAGASALL